MIHENVLMTVFSTEYPAPSSARGKSFHSALLLLVKNPLHADTTALEALPVPPHCLTEMLGSEWPPTVVDLGFFRFRFLFLRIIIPFTIFGSWSGRSGRRGCRQVGLLLS